MYLRVYITSSWTWKKQYNHYFFSRQYSYHSISPASRSAMSEKFGGIQTQVSFVWLLSPVEYDTSHFGISIGLCFIYNTWTCFRLWPFSDINDPCLTVWFNIGWNILQKNIYPLHLISTKSKYIYRSEVDESFYCRVEHGTWRWSELEYITRKIDSARRQNAETQIYLLKTAGTLLW